MGWQSGRSDWWKNCRKMLLRIWLWWISKEGVWWSYWPREVHSLELCSSVFPRWGDGLGRFYYSKYDRFLWWYEIWWRNGIKKGEWCYPPFSYLNLNLFLPLCACTSLWFLDPYVQRIKCLIRASMSRRWQISRKEIVIEYKKEG